MLPVQAVVTALLSSAPDLIALQIFGGIGTGLFAALTPIWLADVTRGAGITISHRASWQHCGG